MHFRLKLMTLTTPRTRVFEVFSDPSHAWLKVRKADLRKMHGKLWRKHYTMFSHERRDHVFLEEDTDVSTFRKALEKKNIPYRFKERNQCNHCSPIRRYIPLQPIGD